MIRFIDLRDQITDAEDCPVNFAFYDTVRSVFLELDGRQDWPSKEDFLADLKTDARWGEQRERFLRKLPEWVV